MAVARLCQIDGCGKKFYARGWCYAHYQRWWKHGDPIGGTLSPGKAVDYFYSVVEPYEGKDCLIWPHTRVRGYAMFHVDGQNHYVSRFLCEISHGAAPSSSHEAAHLCGNGANGCVTKAHLAWKTRTENEHDKISHGTDNRGERCGTSKLTSDQVRLIRSLAGKESYRCIASRFGVTAGHVSDIIARKRWSWMD